MDYHEPIRLFGHPWIWIQDKYETGINAKGLYVVALLPTLFMLIGFIANILTIFHIQKQNVASEIVVIILGTFLFVFGLINLVFLYLIAKAKVRLGRERDNYKILHKNIIEEIRDYRTHKRWKEMQAESFFPDDIKRYIQEILSKFNDNYMKRMHSPQVSTVIKYQDYDNLVPIRVGGDQAERNNEPESLKKSFIYQALNEPGKTMRYIYVKYLDKPDKYEYKALGKYLTDVQTRAKGKYSTFIALPIRTGQAKHVSGAFKTRQNLGMLGFDLRRKYGFGNFETHELEYIACFVDMISELVQDLIGAKRQKVANQTNLEVQ